MFGIMRTTGEEQKAAIEVSMQNLATLEEAFKKFPAEKRVFEKLAFTHKREYIEWLLSAKKPETRERRREQLIDKLKARLKRVS